jgi:hypothetical protein
MSREERIAARLIASLDSLMPASCRTTIRAGWLEVAVDGEAPSSVALAMGERAPDVGAFNVLSTIQDVIVRSSGRPWPPASDPTDVPYPAATVRQGLLVAWFGSESAPTLKLPPIDLATV